MPAQEYKVVPAPTKGRKGPGIKGAEARFAHAIETLMNEMAADGWRYLRSDMLPHEERHGIRSSQKTYRSLLVFQREAVATDQPDLPLTDETQIQSDEPVIGPSETDQEPEEQETPDESEETEAEEETEATLEEEKNT